MPAYISHSPLQLTSKRMSATARQTAVSLAEFYTLVAIKAIILKTSKDLEFNNSSLQRMPSWRYDIIVQNVIRQQSGLDMTICVASCVDLTIDSSLTTQCQHEIKSLSCYRYRHKPEETKNIFTRQQMILLYYSGTIHTGPLNCFFLHASHTKSTPYLSSYRSDHHSPKLSARSSPLHQMPAHFQLTAECHNMKSQQQMDL